MNGPEAAERAEPRGTAGGAITETEDEKDAAAAFGTLYRTIVKLRSPEGCPWDREQSPLSLRGDLLEETYECIEAIGEERSPSMRAAHVREELGDLFLLVTMIAYMHEQEQTFSVASALAGITEKLIRRHPHVFGDVKVKDSAGALANWAKIKVEQEGRKPKDSVLDGVSTALPVLEQAYRLQKKAAQAGFDWPDISGIFGKIAEETEEIRNAMRGAAESAEGAAEGGRSDAGPAAARLEEELGDLIFSAVNLCRFLKVDPTLALQRSTGKFVRRFKYVEGGMKKAGQAMKAEHLARMDALWNEAKQLPPDAL